MTENTPTEHEFTDDTPPEAYEYSGESLTESGAVLHPESANQGKPTWTPGRDPKDCAPVVNQSESTPNTTPNTTPSTPNIEGPAGMHLLSHAPEPLGSPLAPSQPKLSEQIPRRYHTDEFNTAREAEGVAAVAAGRIPLSAHGISVDVGKPASYNWFNTAEKQQLVRIVVDGVKLNPAIPVERMDADNIDETSDWYEVIALVLDYSKNTIYSSAKDQVAREKIAEWFNRRDDEYEFRTDAIQDAETKSRAADHARHIRDEDMARIVIELLREKFPKLT
ncbi:hypothetical protein CMP1-72 [Clavibacter phage CMP1]|uniref:Uncharacterized protein n=1 Tax=Clavibacter phage CMP1 TaxID=686439 RepID=D0U256_9CAUD|nr:hypothetical protein CMP1-72 [Clavibacter phage CMP1]ACY35964.1 hypothetical protein CMP1-72 [Clavibacter phage CMP1]